MTAQRWPLDFAALRRGDQIPAAKVEEAVGLPQTHDNYWRAVLRLRDTILDHFERERGDIGVIVTTRDNGIQILTDEECVAYVCRWV